MTRSKPLSVVLGGGARRGRWRARRWALWLPSSWIQHLRRLYYAWEIRRGVFGTDDVAYRILPLLLQPGDFVVDVGANVGRYTLHMAELVGSTGHVLAIEPLPATAEVLLANLVYAGCHHVTVVQAAASDCVGVARLRVPTAATGFAAHYFAHLVDPDEPNDDEQIRVLSCTVDALVGPMTVALVKIDVERHEQRVLQGMRHTCAVARPFVLIELTHDATRAILEQWGYEGQRLGTSQDWLFWPRERASLALRAFAHVDRLAQRTTS